MLAALDCRVVIAGKGECQFVGGDAFGRLEKLENKPSLGL